MPDDEPRMKDLTSTPTLFSAYTPEPATATPAVPPTAMAAEPAMTTLLMRWRASAESVMAPADCTLLLLR
jgi:hypothetical protein